MVLKTFNFSNAIMARWSRLTPHILHIWSPYSPTVGREGGKKKKDENNVGVSSPSSRRAAGKTWQGSCHDNADSRIRQQSGEYGQTSQAARKIPGISSIFPSNCSEMLKLCRQIFLVEADLNWCYHLLGHQTTTSACFGHMWTAVQEGQFRPASRCERTGNVSVLRWPRHHR